MENLAIQTNPKSLISEACTLRKDIIEALYQVGGGHYGGALSVLDIILTLYRKILKVSPDFPAHPLRDRFILSKGHAAISLYAVLRNLGFTNEPLEEYGQFGSPLEGHPDMIQLPGVDFSTGSLGQGLSVGLGMAFALRSSEARVWVVLGDGECQEGQVWEAAMLAARYKMEQLIAVVDHNGYQEWGWTYDPTLDNDPVPDIREKWEAFGWQVFDVNGNDPYALIEVFEAAREVRHKPSVIIAKTIKGKGFPMMEGAPQRFHCTQLTEEEYRELKQIK